MTASDIVTRLSRPRLLRYARRSHGPLQDNHAHSVAANHALVLHRARAIYSVIPKNACSTLRYSVALANGVLAGPGDIDWIHDNTRHQRASLSDLVRAEYSFVVLRDPYTRVPSMFLDKVVSQKTPLRNLAAAAGIPAPLGNVTFRSFVAALASSPKALASDNHWFRQIEFLVYEDYDDVFQLERFGHAVERLRDRIGLTVADARKLTRHGTDRFTLLRDRFYGDMPIRQLRQMQKAGVTPAPEALYDRALLDQISTLYAADIALYEAHFGRADLLPNRAALAA